MPSWLPTGGLTRSSTLHVWPSPPARDLMALHTSEGTNKVTLCLFHLDRQLLRTYQPLPPRLLSQSQSASLVVTETHTKHTQKHTQNVLTTKTYSKHIQYVLMYSVHFEYVLSTFSSSLWLYSGFILVLFVVGDLGVFEK